MLFKLGAKNIKHNPLMNLLIILQMSVAFVILISMISTIVSRFAFYKPFAKDFKKNGQFYSLGEAFSIEDNAPINDVGELKQYLKGDYKIMTAYENVHSYIDEKGNEHGSNKTVSYDDGLVERFTPELEAGSWLDTDKPLENTLQTVVSQNPYGIKAGDTITVKFALPGFKTVNLETEVVGVLKENANILSVCQKPKHDCRDIYSNYNYEVEQKPLFIFREAELENNGIYGIVNGPTFIEFPDDISDETIESDLNAMRGIRSICMSASYDEMKKNSLSYIFSQLYNLLPIFICVLILTLVGAVSTSALSAKRQLKNYAVYYICGLKWRQCAIVNFWSAFISVASAFVISLILTAIVKATGIFGQTVIWVGFWQIIGCIAAAALYIVISIILPLSIIGKNTPNQVLKTN